MLRPYRQYLPTPAWFLFRSRMAQLNSFLINFFRERWQARHGDGAAKRPRKDILDRILDSIEVRVLDRGGAASVLFDVLGVWQGGLGCERKDILDRIWT